MKRLSAVFPSFAAIFVVVLLLDSCTTEPEQTGSGEQIYFTGAENRLTEDGLPTYFDDGQGLFKAGGHQVNNEVFDGLFSVRVDSAQPYGMPITFTDVQVGEFFEASAWILDTTEKVTLIAGVSGRSTYSLNTTEVNIAESDKGWSRHYLSLAIETPIDSLTFYVFAGGGSGYADNFEIRRHSTRPPLKADSLDVLRIYIPDSGMEKLTEYKTKALEQAIISDDLKEYVDGFILDKGDSIPIEIRLKGDWTDHLENGKTSYRIKTDVAYRNLTSFSIQHPATRNFMHEWFMHELCDGEDLLATTYDFLPVEINGESQGIYAIEEHFDKQVVESRHRREGPILKMDESGFWGLLASGMKDSLKGSYPYYESSLITCFKAGRTERTPSLSSQFDNAAYLLYLFKNRYPDPAELFNLEKTAKYYALMDLGNIAHSFAWHNRRFYANPVTTELEIIGFDMIPAVLPMNEPIAFRNFHGAPFPRHHEQTLDYHLFRDPVFRMYYTHYANRFNSVAYLDSVFAALDSSIRERENLIGLEFPGYRLNRQFYYDMAAFNRTLLAGLDTAWDNFMTRCGDKPLLIKPDYQALDEPFLLKEVSVNVYRKLLDSTTSRLEFENFHLADVTIVGYSTKAGEDSVFLLDKPIFLERYDGVSDPAYATVTLPKKVNKIHFTVSNIPGAVQSKKVFEWAKPSGHPRLELIRQFRADHPAFRVSGDTLFIRKGSHVMSELTYVPKKYAVVFEPGAEIDFRNGGGLILNNTVTMTGTADSKIRFTSSDSTSQGITILNGKRVTMAHVEISNLGTLNQEGWALTGAVTIYESEVVISHCTIRNNNSEDALNIIRSHFVIDSLVIANTSSDGFDADFCTGSLTRSLFRDTHNDCIDFSGSEVDISYLTIRNAGDKGVSCGEGSTLTLHDIDIHTAATGLASKDGSLLTGENIKAVNCEVGVALYKKKPEYDFSRMILTNSSYQNIKTHTLIEKGARLTFNGVDVFGSGQFDIDAMYARFKK